MQKESKVLGTSFNREFTTVHGTYYVHDVKFENGDEGEYTSISKDQNKFVEGEVARYEHEQRQSKKGDKFIKISPAKDEGSFTPRNKGGGSSFSSGSSKFDGTGAMVGNAISNAILLVCHGIIEMGQMEEAAKGICETSMKLKSLFEPK